MKKINVLELFGGIGAPRKALERIIEKNKLNFVDYVEIEDFVVEAYNKIYNENHKAQSVVTWQPKDNTPIDILIHGSPCQDFSTIGSRAGGEEGTKTRSSLMWETVDIIENRLKELPKVVIWENVKGVLSKATKPTFDKYLDKMESLGYKNTYEVLAGIDAGIPQTRERVFVISILKNQTFFNKFFDFKNIKKYKNKSITKNKLEYLIDDDNKKLNDFLEKNITDIKYFINQPSMIKAVGSGKIKVIENIANTITTKHLRWNNAGFVKAEYKEPIKDKNGNIMHVFEINNKKNYLRTLTEKECWRLMGFDDEDYEKVSYMTSAKKYHLAGNSIIVQVLEKIFKELYRGCEMEQRTW